MRVDWKGKLAVLSAFLLGIAICASAFILLSPPPASCETQSLFSPGADSEILSLINSAHDYIDIEVYTFSYMPYADALIDAKKRGVKVRVIMEPRLESSTTQQTMFNYLGGNGIETKWASATFTLTHSKMMVVDGKKVLVGSINFSKAAAKTNREAAAIVCGSAVADYKNVFESDWNKAAAS